MRKAILKWFTCHPSSHDMLHHHTIPTGNLTRPFFAEPTTYIYKNTKVLLPTSLYLAINPTVMASDESLPTLKILLIGPSGAGKSACTYPGFRIILRATLTPQTVLIRYCDDLFDSESSTATIGVDFKVSHYLVPFKWTLTVLQLKKMSVHGTPYRLNLLDTAGQGKQLFGL